MFSCKEASRLYSESLDRRLSLWERLSLRFHLVMCRLCTGHTADLDAIREAARKLGRESSEVPSNHALSDEARQRMKQIVSQRIE